MLPARVPGQAFTVSDETLDRLSVARKGRPPVGAGLCPAGS
jgi:hypothetical protein